MMEECQLENTGSQTVLEALFGSMICKLEEKALKF